jgi:aerobic-type carbon monoxide dehydrogenase small subunit (CoxS/CutS family)
MATSKSDRVTRRASGTRSVGFTVNGQPYRFNVGNETSEVSPTRTLSQTLRETLGLTGTKISCDHGACGCCAVIMDGKAVLSCQVLTIECDGKAITTIEGLKDPKTGALDPLQQSFIDHTAFQCGFCTPGMIITARAFLDENPHPTEEEIKEALSGNFCRCISHYQVVRAVMSVAEKGSGHGRGQL